MDIRSGAVTRLGSLVPDCRLSAFLVLTAVSLIQASLASSDPGMRVGEERPCGQGASVPREWSQSEVWAWLQICRGQPADFDTLLRTRKGSDRHTEDRFDDERRRLGPSFLRTVLTQEPYRTAAPPEGVRIHGAQFYDDVDLRDAVLVRALGIFDSRFLGKLVMNRLRTQTAIAFPGSVFKDSLSMRSMVVGGDLNMTDGVYGEVAMNAVKVAGGVSMTDSVFSGRLSMNGATVSGSLHMRKAEFAEVNLNSVTVGRQVGMSGSTFSKKLDMGNISTGGSVFLNKESTFRDVVLRGSQVGGQVSLSEAVVLGRFDGGSMSIEQDLIMYGARFDRPIELPSVRVAGSIEFGNATLSGLNLLGATIGKALAFGTLGQGSTKWRSYVDESGATQPPMVLLWNATAGALADEAESWPDNVRLFLRDFTYDRLTSLDTRTIGTMGEPRDASWYVAWLALDPLYSFQPYRHLAAVMETYGEDGKAQQILIAGRDRQLTKLDWSSPEKWTSLAFRWLIGYGYGARELWALWWAIPFLLVGGVLAHCRIAEYPKETGESLGFWYSFDMLLPGVWLNERHARVVLKGGVRHYFCFHRLAGFVLLSFVLAGLAGLTD